MSEIAPPVVQSAEGSVLFGAEHIAHVEQFPLTIDVYHVGFLFEAEVKFEGVILSKERLNIQTSINTWVSDLLTRTQKEHRNGL